MVFVGIDVAKDKHDCFIINSNGEVLYDVFTIPNNKEGFDDLYQKIQNVAVNLSDIKVGLEATGHYNYNILGYLNDKGLPTYVINPLHANLYRKSLSLRKTKTDKVDARIIATLLMSDVDLKSYSSTLYHNEELKSLTRYRFDKIKQRGKLRATVSRLVVILFPELEGLTSSLHSASMCKLLAEYPGASYIADANLKKLTNLLHDASRGQYNREKAVLIKNAAKNSIGSVMPAKSLELKHTIRMILEINSEIDEIEKEIKKIMDKINSPILSIPGISYRMGAMIIAEIGDFDRFDSPDKILAFAGLSPSTYQSGQFQSSHSKMEKRGSKYLRYALFNATRFICRFDNKFADYLAKKLAEGKHYYVAISHAVKKLVRVIYHLEKTKQLYIK